MVDPENTARYLHIRGTAELMREGAVDHLDALTRSYTDNPRFHGYVYPEQQRERATRVTVRIQAHRLTLDAIHP